MESAPPTDDEEERIKALKRLEILDTVPESSYNRLVEIASTVCGTPIALLTLVDEERQWFKARIGLDAHETPRSQAFCAHAIHKPGLMIVKDASHDPRFHDNPLVTGDPGIRFYAGVPIPAPSGNLLGTLCVIDRRPRNLTAQQKKVLGLLAEQAAEALLTRQVALTLRAAVAAESGEARRKALNAVSHELRTPMTPIKLQLALLRMHVNDTKAREEINMIERNLSRLEAAIAETVRALAIPARD